MMGMRSTKKLILRMKNSCKKIENRKANFTIMLLVFTILTFSPVVPASSNGTGSIPVSWDINFSLVDNGSIDLIINFEVKSGHDPVYNLAPGDKVYVTNNITRGSSYINVSLFNLGTFSDLEGNYIVPLDSFLANVSIPVPEASANIPLMGNVTAYLEFFLGLRIRSEKSGSGTSGGGGVTYEFLIVESNEIYGFEIPDSTSNGDLIVVETTFWLMIWELGIVLKVDNTSVLTLDPENIQESWPASTTLSQNIEVGLSKPTPAFEAFLLIPVFTLLVVISKYKENKKD